MLALLCLHSAIWLPAILAFGTAGGRDLARKTTAGTPKFDWGCWLVATVTLFLTVVCASLCNADLRTFAIRLVCPAELRARLASKADVILQHIL